MLFDPESAFLRQIRMGQIEVIRGVHAAVRDRDWDTISFDVLDLQVDRSDRSFEISFNAVCKGVDFGWSGQVSGTESGNISYRFTGQTESTFWKNRIGLYVLHPNKECASTACQIEHVDGTRTSDVFPKWISPNQPFKNIRSIQHEVSPGVLSHVVFHGDTFEMEDHRNWTDASFKTYGTPLELPFPVELKAADRIEQQVSISMVNDKSASAAQANVAVSADQPVRIEVDWEKKEIRPSLGFSIGPHCNSISPESQQKLRSLGADHVRLDLWIPLDGWRQKLERAKKFAAAIDTRLELAVVTDRVFSTEWDDLLREMDDAQTQIARCLILNRTSKATTETLAASASQSLKNSNLSIPVVFGTDAYFAELNRNRFAAPEECEICYSINPQVHAFDKLSLRETLSAQADTVDSAFNIFGRPVVVSPVTLKPRFNPNATSVAFEDRHSIEPETDDRQGSGFVAAWTVGSLSQLAPHSRVSSLTYFETHGPRGIIDSTSKTFPTFQVFQELLQAKYVCKTHVSDPLGIAGLAVIQDDRRRFIVGNMSEERKTVELPAIHGSRRTMDVDSETVVIVDEEQEV